MTEQATLPGLNSELEPGEPTFTLRGRDMLAPHLVALWAAMRKGDTASAVVIFSDMVADPGYHYRINGGAGYPADKVGSASTKAKEMVDWRKATNLVAYEVHTVT